jgi:hypothetical protein
MSFSGMQSSQMSLAYVDGRVGVFGGASVGGACTQRVGRLVDVLRQLFPDQSRVRRKRRV